MFNGDTADFVIMYNFCCPLHRIQQFKYIIKTNAFSSFVNKIKVVTVDSTGFINAILKPVWTYNLYLFSFKNLL